MIWYIIGGFLLSAGLGIWAAFVYLAFRDLRRYDE